MTSFDRIAVALLVALATAALLIKIAVSSKETIDLPPSRPASEVIVTGAVVNLRSGPSLAASVLDRAKRGQELELVKIQGDWYNVKWRTGTAWVSKLYASLVEDCGVAESTVGEGVRSQLVGEWKGEIGGRPATFLFYTRGGQICAYVLYLGVKESLTVAVPSPGMVTLSGTRYERLNGETGEFWLDIFSGRFENASSRLEGSFVDAKGNGGEWFATHTESSP